MIFFGVDFSIGKSKKVIKKQENYYRVHLWPFYFGSIKNEKFYEMLRLNFKEIK
jgi:hypothetical protein